MNDVEEMAAPEIAETLEISMAAFKSRLHRARLYVRHRLFEVSNPRPREAQAAI
jgi:DNA-directed RNA polymerase specialized sigma24 family protein